MALVVTQAAGVLVLSPGLLLAAGAACWLIAVAVLRICSRAFSRNRLGERH